MAAMGRHQFTFNLDDLLLRERHRPIGGAPAHFIFISAFCCSTLLARYLEHVPGCLVLREPGLLGQIAMLRRRPEAAGVPDWEREWAAWAGLVLGLLTRSFAAGDTVVIKAADVCNNLGNAVLARDPASRILLLAIGLRSFVLSVLKSSGRRAWTCARARFWRREASRFPRLAAINPAHLNDARKAAYLWLLTDALWRELGEYAAPGSLQAMDGEMVAARPVEALRRAADFFGLALTAAELDAAIASPTASHHAKEAGRDYAGADRARDLAAWDQRFGGQADAALDWAAQFWPGTAASLAAALPGPLEG
ncbi:MAG: hypothetical protein ACREFQ_10450 [Stellaceae bacterium]